MKFFTVFAAILALTAAGSIQSAVSTWTLNELASAIENPNTDPAMLPYLEAALNEMMESIVAGQTPAPAVISMPVAELWTLPQLTAAIHDPNTSPAFLPYLENALNEMMIAMHSGQNVHEISVNIPAMNVNMWTMPELAAALENPETDPELAVYLEHALNQIMMSIMTEKPITSIAVITPPGVPTTAPETAVVPPLPIFPIVPEPVKPEPEVIPPLPVFPVIPEPEVIPPLPVFPVVPEPVKPEPVIPPTVVVEPPVQPVSSPLVQIIINVNAQGQAPAPVSPVIDDEVPQLAVSPWGPHNPAPVDDEVPQLAVSPWGPHNPAPVDEVPQLAVSPWGPHNPAPVDEVPQLAVSPWGPHNPAPVDDDEPIIAISPWGPHNPAPAHH